MSIPICTLPVLFLTMLGLNRARKKLKRNKAQTAVKTSQSAHNSRIHMPKTKRALAYQAEPLNLLHKADEVCKPKASCSLLAICSHILSG